MGLDSDDAVLVVDAGGRRYAIDLRQVAEIRGVEALRRHPSRVDRSLGVVHRMGVRVPVYDLRELVAPTATSDAEAVVVLDLPDRYAALLVDAVCDVRIVARRLPASASESAAGSEGSVAWIASWDGGKAPVLDVTSWLLGDEAGRAA
jgi:chemotaxis signal transduction protein